MDPVLHHRICGAARRRHAAINPGKKAGSGSSLDAATGYNPQIFDIEWDKYASMITAAAFHHTSFDTTNRDWLRELKPLLDAVNQARSDRGPLKVQLKGSKAGDFDRIEFQDEKDLETQARLTLFFERYAQSS